MITSDQKPFWILSIDGGGVRGIIPARVLQYIEEGTQKPIHELFDLIVGTSTGGLIALGLTCSENSQTPKYSAKEIVNIYLRQASQIFSNSIFRKILTGNGLWGAKYDRTGYDLILKNMFGDFLLSQALCPVVIPTYSLIKSAPNIFTSRKTLESKVDYFMRDIAGATSAAPTYFPPKQFTDTQGTIHIEADGGIFANNPETIGVTESFNLMPDLQRENIRIISIGTGSPKLAQTASKLTDAGMIGWVMKANLIDVMMDADSDWYEDEINILYSKAHRLQATLPENLGQLDNTTSENLNGLLQAAENYIEANKQLIDNIVTSLVSGD